MRLSIKGSLKNAKRSAARHGVPVRDCVAFGPRNQTIACDAPESARTKVMNWYAEKHSSLKQGRGYAPGALLFFNGARKRRKRRR